MREKGLKYYNYVSFYRGIPVYVGKGSGNRWHHTLEGKSSSDLINDFHFRYKYFNDMPLDTYVVKRFSTDLQASRNERKLIGKYLPYCNKCSGRTHSTDYDFREKLIDLCTKLGYSKPETLHSKFDFRLLFTPKGLLCSYERLNENSPFEEAREPYHFRIKAELYKYFPEYLLHFIENDPETHGTLLSSFNTKAIYFQMFRLGHHEVYRGVDKNWKVSAIFGGSFNFVSEFGLCDDNSLSPDEFLFNNYDHKHHYDDYAKHTKKTQSDEIAKKRKLDHNARKEAELMAAKLKATNDPTGGSDLKPPSERIRVKNSEGVQGKLRKYGYSGELKGKWVYLCCKNGVSTGFMALSEYKLMKEDDFLITRLASFIKEKQIDK